MSATESLKEMLSRRERKLLEGLSRPNKIQEFLDQLAYSTDDIYRCPLRVLRERTAQCFDGALFGAAALRHIGHRPLILDMIPNKRDDDHILALYKVDGRWGATAKSNFAGLRFREPMYRTLRELIMVLVPGFTFLHLELGTRGGLGSPRRSNGRTDPFFWLCSSQFHRLIYSSRILM